MSASIRTHVLAVGASVLVNGGFLAMVMFVASPAPPEVYEEAAMMVTMVGPASEAQSASEASDDVSEADASDDDHPPEKPELEPVKPVPVKPSPLEPIASAPSEPVVDQNTATALARPSKPASQSAPSAKSTAPASPSAPSASGPVAQAASMSNTSRNHTNAYLARVRAYVESHKVYPRGAKRLRQEGVVTVSFTIDREGRLLSSRIVKSSGIAAFDQEALEVLKRAEPMPKPPKDVIGNRLEMITQLEFSLEK
ncbi:energy transducer TonB [Asticcacaulis sp. SL142]|uniref:energy transducer TonB n=1 Tax=Asticcacaulis sp. SL142 TaxID=2995155 RepID=UPI00226CB193|nr:energy transducer TonB [Asticcacaulis sp. SL142]WAC47992.1 energy transducer TonB [Asticcacaulis sp. SL142]